jgi:biotin carboxylase
MLFNRPLPTDNTPRLLMLGGNRYNMNSIKAAKQAGFYVLVADRNPQADGFAEADLALPIDLFDYESMLSAIEQIGGIQGIVSMAEAGVRPMAHLSKRLGLRSISEAAAANATSKAGMRQAWAGSPFSVDFRVVNSEAEMREAITQLGIFPLLVKPDRSFGGSRGVKRVDNLEEALEAFHFAQNGGLSNTAVVLEGFADGTEHSCEVLIVDGKAQVLCIGQKVKSPFPYRVDVSVQYPAPLTPEQHAKVADMCQFAVQALGLSMGVAHVEFAYTAHGPVLFELGARCGGGHTPQIAYHVSGVNEMVAFCKMASGLPLDNIVPAYQRGADYRFLIFPQKDSPISHFESPALNDNIFDTGYTFALGQSMPMLKSTSDRAGFVVTFGDTRDHAVQIADVACQQAIIHYSDGSSQHAYTLADLLTTPE